MATKNYDNFFGEIISSYSRTQAIEDGVLVDLSAQPELRELVRDHFKYPVACTTAVWEIIERAVANPRHANDLKGVVHDILFMSKAPTAKSPDPSTRIFPVIITGAGAKRTYTLKMVCGPGDDAVPVLTIMLENED